MLFARKFKFPADLVEVIAMSCLYWWLRQRERPLCLFNENVRWQR